MSRDLDYTGETVYLYKEQTCGTSILQSHRQLKEFPKCALLPEVEHLDLSGNEIEVIPSEIGRLSKLSYLNLSGNCISELPEEIGLLKNLKCLNLSNNLITQLPLAITQLTNLTSLILNNNQIDNLPNELWSLPSLAFLLIRNNRLLRIDASICELKCLKFIDVAGNPLDTPPMEVVKKGISDIANYYRQLLDRGLEAIYEAKLLIVGEGGAGKTTLARKLLDKDYVLQTDIGTTYGIDISTWFFKLDDDKDFQVNIWDFGGQQIYHATHQFFLTKSSLYIVVAESRKEDANLYYWLDILSLLSHKSPVILVKNEKNDREVELDERKLRITFPNIKEIIASNFSDNRGLDEIIHSVEYHMTQLPHVKTTLPTTWKKVREILEAREENYIGVDEYIHICEENGFASKEDSLQLSRYLHDLGVCLHYQDDPYLSKTIILSPTWGTDAVYRVLDNKGVKNNKGEFSFEDLTHIWDDPMYCDKQIELLQLMMKFHLCYRLPNNDKRYIAPQLLDTSRPDYEWESTDNLYLKYVYEFMPKGIITRFIVDMHQYIKDQRLVWRSGVIIERDSTRAEIIEYMERAKIEIRISGDRKSDLMSNIIFVFDTIHASYTNLKYDKYIPCKCSQCLKTDKPYFHKYQDLVKLQQRRSDTICMESSESVKIYKMISDMKPVELIIEQELQKNHPNNFAQIMPYHINFIENVGQYTSLEGEKIITVGDGSTISAPVTVADEIEDCFNIIEGCDAGKELVEVLKELLINGTELIKTLEGKEDSEAPRVLQCLDYLVKEITSDNSRDTHLQLFVGDLLQLGAHIGADANVLLTTVRKIGVLCKVDFSKYVP